MSIVSSVLSFRSSPPKLNDRLLSIMESIYAIAFGLGLRILVDAVSHNFKLTGSLIGLWEGVITLHFLKKMPKSSDPYIAYGVRLFVDFLLTDSIERLVLVLIWTAFGMVLADVTPAIWDDIGLKRVWRHFRRDISTIYDRIPTVAFFPPPRTVRFVPPREPSIISTSIATSQDTPIAVVPPSPSVPSEPFKRRIPGYYPGYFSDMSDTDLGSLIRGRPSPRTEVNNALVLSDSDQSSVGSSSDSTEIPDPLSFNQDEISDINEQHDIKADPMTTPKQKPYIPMPPTPSDSAARWVEDVLPTRPRPDLLPDIPDSTEDVPTATSDDWEKISRRELDEEKPPTPPAKDRPVITIPTSFSGPPIPPVSTTMDSSNPPDIDYSLLDSFFIPQSTTEQRRESVPPPYAFDDHDDIYCSPDNKPTGTTAADDVDVNGNNDDNGDNEMSSRQTGDADIDLGTSTNGAAAASFDATEQAQANAVEEEAMKKQEEETARLKAEEDERARKEEEERMRMEEERMRQEEEERARKEEEEERMRMEEEMRQEEEERARKEERMRMEEEEERIRKEEEMRQEEEERARKEERMRMEEEERIRKEEGMRQEAEEKARKEAKKAEEKARKEAKKAEEKAERQRKEAEDAALRKQKQEEAAAAEKKKEEEERRKEEEAEQKRKDEEAEKKRKDEEEAEQRRVDEEAKQKRQLEEQAEQEAEEKRKAADQQARDIAERQREEAAKLKEAEEAEKKRKDQEEANRAAQAEAEENSKREAQQTELDEQKAEGAGDPATQEKEDDSKTIHGVDLETQQQPQTDNAQDTLHHEDFPAEESAVSEVSVATTSPPEEAKERLKRMLILRAQMVEIEKLLDDRKKDGASDEQLKPIQKTLRKYKRQAERRYAAGVPLAQYLGGFYDDDDDISLEGLAPQWAGIKLEEKLEELLDPASRSISLKVRFASRTQDAKKQKPVITDILDTYNLLDYTVDRKKDSVIEMPAEEFTHWLTTYRASMARHNDNGDGDIW